jgi:serine/threonine-protein kinase
MHLCAACRKLLPPTSSCPDCRAALRPRASDVLVGETIAEHRVEGVLGTGAVGVVYLASDGAGRQRALKLMLPDPSDETAERRFLREAQVIQGLHHPHIVEVYGVGDSGWGTPYFTMECLKGRTLRRRLQDAPPGGLPRDEALGILRQIADALAYAHARGVVHRDLKPENVFLVDTPDGPSVRLLDFGFARSIKSRETRLTATGVVLGTPSYMAPEQVTGVEIGPATDQYSLALIAAELFTGRKVRENCSLAAIVTTEVARPMPEERLAGTGLPRHAVRALVRATQPDPAARFPDVAAFVAAFEGKRSAAGRVPRAAWIALGVAAAIGAAAAAWLLLG